MSQKVLAVPSASGAPGPVASNGLCLRGGSAGDDVWRVLLGEGLLATSLSFGELTRLGRLNRSCRRTPRGAQSGAQSGAVLLQQDLRRRRARAHFAACDHPREGGVAA